MTKKETVKLLSVITAAFSNMQVTEAAVSIWHELLGDLELNTVLVATKKLILESPYPPTIADIRKRVVEIITHPRDEIDAAEAWGEVKNAVRYFGHHNEVKALASMSPRTAKVVGWIGWREICMCEEPGVVRGQFLKMYQQAAEREQKDRLIPVALRNEIQKIAAGMDIKKIS